MKYEKKLHNTAKIEELKNKYKKNKKKPKL